MQLSEGDRIALGEALNEANLLGFEVDPLHRRGAATLAVLTLPEHGPSPDDRRVQFRFWPVGRVAASLRNGTWNDPGAPTVPFTIDQVLAIVLSFGGLPIYGGEFFDVHEHEIAQWGDRVSLDWRGGEDGKSHSIRVFQEDRTHRFLELIVWFDSLEIRNPQGHLISIKEFCAGGKRWWDGFRRGDPRTDGFGLCPFKKA